jgi:hypothetical protein
MEHHMRALILAGTILALALGSIPTEAAAQQRTEVDARADAERNRADRLRLEAETGEPQAVIHDYVSYFVRPVPEEMDVNGFYQKYVDANGIPVLSSSKVPDEALLVVRDIINTMLAYRGDLRENMIERNWRTGVIAETEMTMDMPEYANLRAPGADRSLPVMQSDRDHHANRSRGLGGNPTTGGEENILCYEGTRYWGEHIFVHEFAHAIHSAIRQVDPEMADEISAAYEAADGAGLYRLRSGNTHYAMSNAGEYWAEGVQWWFFSNYGECMSNGAGGFVTVDSPEQFAEYDPTLFELLGRVFRTHHIPADIFHAKQIRPVEGCPGS